MGILEGLLTKLSCQLAVNGRARPVVGPGNVSVLAQRNHGLNGECHAGLAFTDSLVFGVVGDVGRAVEELSDAMTTVSSDDAAVLLLGVLLDDVSKLSNQNSRLHGLDRLLQALSGRLNNTDSIGVGLGFVADVVGLVQIRVVSLMVERHIDIQDVAVDKDTLIWDTVADDFVDRCAA